MAFGRKPGIDSNFKLCYLLLLRIFDVLNITVYLTLMFKIHICTVFLSVCSVSAFETRLLANADHNEVTDDFCSVSNGGLPDLAARAGVLERE